MIEDIFHFVEDYYNVLPKSKIDGDGFKSCSECNIVKMIHNKYLCIFYLGGSKLSFTIGIDDLSHVEFGKEHGSMFKLPIGNDKKLLIHYVYNSLIELIRDFKINTILQ